MNDSLKDPTPSDLIEVLGAFAFALTRPMTPGRRADVLASLTKLAVFSEAEGKLGVMAGIQQLAQAVRMAEQN
jgi:hypothetical protein